MSERRAQAHERVSAPEVTTVVQNLERPVVEARAGHPAGEPVAVSHSWPLSSTGAGVQVAQR